MISRRELPQFYGVRVWLLGVNSVVCRFYNSDIIRVILLKSLFKGVLNHLFYRTLLRIRIILGFCKWHIMNCIRRCIRISIRNRASHRLAGPVMFHILVSVNLIKICHVVSGMVLSVYIDIRTVPEIVIETEIRVVKRTAIAWSQ